MSEIKAKKVLSKKPVSAETRRLVAKAEVAPKGRLADGELTNLRELIGVLQTYVERLIVQQANVSKDMAEMRKEMFLSSLAKAMKNRKKLKKSVASKKNRLLEKCGVPSKATLNDTDVERIKSRVPMT